jgi:hypothetical protein
VKPTRAANVAYLADIDVAAEVRAIGRRMDKMESPRPRVWWRWIVSGGALAAVAAIVLIVMARREPTPDDIEIKGGEIGLIVHAPDRRLATGDTVRAGDRLRFEIAAGRSGYVAVFGVDGTGATTMYFPKQGTAAAAFDPKDPILPGAIELDATPGDETFYAAFSTEPFAILNGQLPPGVRSTRVVLHKRVE